MLKINIICIGKIKEKYFSDAIAEYTKRLGAFCKFTIVELAEEKIRDNIPNQSQISEVLLAEGRSILKKISPSDYVVALTFPHTMARMILTEQIYRAFEISTNGKYHK